MRTVSLLLALGCVLAVGGCGGTDEEPSSAGACGSGTVVARADLDGDGRREQVRLVRGGRCAGSLVTGDGDAGDRLDVAPWRLAGDRVEVVHLAERDLLLVRSRTGRPQTTRPRLLAAGPEGLAEVRLDGGPVLPVVSRQRGAAPLRVTCSRGRLVVEQGTASQPPGVVLAWDLVRTTYRVDGVRATRVERRVVGTDLADPVLRRDRPELFRGSVLRDCAR